MNQSNNPPAPESKSPLRIYNRLESRPRSSDFQRSLRAEIHDPLWMLCRQWQFGEFKGEDTGSAVTAQVKVVSQGVTHDAQQRVYDPGIPMEAQIEALPVQWDLRLRLRVAQYWRRLLDGRAWNGGAAAYYEAFRRAFPLPATPPPDLALSPELVAAWDFAQGSSMDGKSFVAALSQCGGAAASLIQTFHLTDDPAQLNQAGAEFLQWLTELQLVPPANHWNQEQLCYQAAYGVRQSGTQSTVLSASHYNGDYDWYSFDAEQSARHPARTTAHPARHERVETVLFTSKLRFPGMPAARWWELEDSRINFGQLDAAPCHLAQILLTEFALTYSNDWHLIPLSLPVGAICAIDSLVVTDVFGQKTSIQQAGAGDHGWNRFAMFATEQVTAGHAEQRSSAGLFLAPPIPSLASDPVEEVVWLRDELANIVWGVEKIVPSGLGGGADGARLGSLRRAVVEATVTNPSAADTAPYSFQLRSENHPEHWIPFVPIQPLPGVRLKLQRARIKRMVHGVHAGDMTPMTSTLGADQSSYSPMFIDDAEIARSGVRLVRRYQRARGHGGKTLVWLSYTRSAGRGEGASPVRLDQLTERVPAAQ